MSSDFNRGTQLGRLAHGTVQSRNSIVLLFALIVSTHGVLPSRAADPPPKPTPTTTANPQIPVDDLRLQLIPLTRDELAVELAGWIGLVRQKAGEISKAEIDAKVLARPNGSQPAADAKAPPAADAAALEQRDKKLAELPKLRDERTALIDRARLVMADITTKGGKVADEELYLAAVSGLNIDIKDASAAWSTVKGWVLSPEGGLRWIKNIVFFLVTLLLFRIAAGLSAQTTRRVVSMSKQGSELLRDFFVNSVRKAVMLIGIVVAISMLEVNIGPFVAAIGAVGFVVGFALQGTLSNFAAGIMILLYRPYDLGDTVTVAGTTGKVSSMSLVSTTIKTTDNKTVVVPNSAIWGTAIQQHHG